MNSAPVHSIPARTSAMPKALSETANASRRFGQIRNETETVLGAEKATGLMRSNPANLRKAGPYGANVQVRAQRFATVSEFRAHLVETCALDARRALDELLTVETPCRLAGVMRQLDWTQGKASNWLGKFTDRYGVMSRNGALYDWAVPVDARKETGS